jgi:hypothetical protein
MATQLRDTHFGHLVRYLSGKKLFLYPDEHHIPDIASRDHSVTEREKLNDSSKDVILVSWYDQDDPEVSDVPLDPLMQILMRGRIHRTGPVAGNCWLHSRCAS